MDEKLRVAIPKPLRDLLLPPDSSPNLFVAPGTDGSLTIYTEEAFARLADQLAGASPTGQAVRDFSRLFFARAQRVEVDRQGRIRIPPELAQLIGLTGATPLRESSSRETSGRENSSREEPGTEAAGRGAANAESSAFAENEGSKSDADSGSTPENGPNEVVLVGVRDHLELWEGQRWRTYLAARQEQYDQIAERAFS